MGPHGGARPSPSARRSGRATQPRNLGNSTGAVLVLRVTSPPPPRTRGTTPGHDPEASGTPPPTSWPSASCGSGCSSGSTPKSTPSLSVISTLCIPCSRMYRVTLSNEALARNVRGPGIIACSAVMFGSPFSAGPSSSPRTTRSSLTTGHEVQFPAASLRLASPTVSVSAQVGTSLSAISPAKVSSDSCPSRGSPLASQSCLPGLYS